MSDGSFADTLFDAHDTLDALEVQLTDRLLEILGKDDLFTHYEYDASDRSLTLYGISKLELSPAQQQALWNLGFVQAWTYCGLDSDDPERSATGKRYEHYRRGRR